MTDRPGRRRILFLTGTRADFGKLKPLIMRVQESPAFESAIFATGLHMLARYGSTVYEIEKAGCRNVYSFINQDGAITSQMDIVLANTIVGLSHYVREFPPDLLVVHGDRVETLAGAIVGALNNILVAHVEGGEVSGTVDELIRHAVSKLSHLHFVANAEARSRLLQMGEQDESIFVIGSPDIDVMLSDALPGLDAVRRRYAIDFDRFGIFLYHPVTTELPQLEQRVREVVAGLERCGRNFVAIYPNNDTGSDVILAALARLRDHPRIRVVPSMRFEYFLSLLRHADVIVGNSSAGIREAPVYGVPTVNLGSRQRNRFSWPSIRDTPEDAAAIAEALREVGPRAAPTLHFGTGHSAELFLAALASEGLLATATQKQFRDLGSAALAAFLEAS